MFQAFIYASCFFLMPENLNGLYSRGGAIFSAAFMNTVTALGDVPVIFFGRLTVQKHKSYAMYHPAAFHLGQVRILHFTSFTSFVPFTSITSFAPITSFASFSFTSFAHLHSDYFSFISLALGFCVLF